MDFVWNRSQAEGVRADFERALTRQAENMRATAAEYREIAAGREKEALAQDKVATSAMMLQAVPGGRRNSPSMTELVPDTAARSLAGSRAAAYREQAAALRASADRLDTAIRNLATAIKSSNELFKRLQHEAESADKLHAGQLEQKMHEIESLIRRMEAIRDGINSSFPMNLSSLMPELPNAASSEILSILHALALAGTPIYCMFGGDPVNLSTGSFIYTKEDIAIPGRYPLAFKRFYNSIGGTEDVLGANWTHSLNIRLYDKEEAVHVMFGDGHMESYGRIDDGRYVSPLDSDSLLLKTDEGWELSANTGESHLFDKVGALQSITDANGNGTEFEYTDGLLAKASNPCGSLSFEYTDKKRISKVSDHTGREARFEYTGKHLCKVTNPEGADHRYGYDAYGNLSKISNPLGIDVINNEYDRHGRMVRQSFADGGTYGLAYDDKTTTATEQNGNKIKYERDSSYRTVRTVYPDSEERFEYNIHSKRTKHTDRNGNVRKYEYDELGNMSKHIDPLGNETVLEYNAYSKMKR